MKKRTCCFTGHRKIPPEQYEEIRKRLKSEITAMIQQGVIYFGAGGALGFDTMAAQTVLALREQYPQIKLILVLPCKTQTRGWNEEEKATYENIKKACDKYIYISDAYTYGCMHERNRHLVDSSSYCICYLTKYSGGTAYTVEYAKKKGLTVMNLAISESENRKA